MGKYHSFSAGLLIGGKSIDDESKQINSMEPRFCMFPGCCAAE